MAKKAKRTPVTIRSFTKPATISLMKIYRDKIGATLLDAEPHYHKETTMWEFSCTMPWDDLEPQK